MSASDLALYLLLALGLIAAAAVLHVAFWSWWLRIEPEVDEVLWPRTRDGWTLGLSRRRPRGPARGPPVLLVHGLAMNRHAFDFGVEAWSLAALLAKDGFDCFVLDLRGHGLSRRGPSRHWTIDDYARQDVPAALDAVSEATGSPDVLWVGHSQGSLLGLATCVLHPERVRAIAALAAPVFYDGSEPRLRTLVGMRGLPLARHFRAFARWLSPFVGFLHPALVQIVLNTRNMAPPIYRRFMANGVENLQPGVLEQFAIFVAEDSFRSFDGKTDYRALLPRARQPALFISAVNDGLATPAAVEGAFALWGGPKRLWRAERGFGHVDLLLGRDAPGYVFPEVQAFLLEHSTPVAGAAQAAAPGV